MRKSDIPLIFVDASIEITKGSSWSSSLLFCYCCLALLIPCEWVKASVFHCAKECSNGWKMCGLWSKISAPVLTSHVALGSVLASLNFLIFRMQTILVFTVLWFSENEASERTEARCLSQGKCNKYSCHILSLPHFLWYIVATFYILVIITSVLELEEILKVPYSEFYLTLLFLTCLSTKILCSHLFLEVLSYCLICIFRIWFKFRNSVFSFTLKKWSTVFHSVILPCFHFSVTSNLIFLESY